MNPKVDFYFTKAKKWQKEIRKLRMIVLDCGLTEELKWGVPCYTFQKSNIVLIHVFKEYCAFLFFKGALLNDANGILIQQTKNVQAARQIRGANRGLVNGDTSWLTRTASSSTPARRRNAGRCPSACLIGRKSTKTFPTTPWSSRLAAA